VPERERSMAFARVVGASQVIQAMPGRSPQCWKVCLKVADALFGMMDVGGSHMDALWVGNRRWVACRQPWMAWVLLAGV